MTALPRFLITVFCKSHAQPGVHNLDYTKWDLKEGEDIRLFFFVLFVFFFLPALVGLTVTIV